MVAMTVRGTVLASRAALIAGVGILLVLETAGCGGEPPKPDPTPIPVSTLQAPAGALAGRVAAAMDKHFVATYTLTSGGRPQRTVTAGVAGDGSWRVDVPGGALGGTADIAVAGNRDGVYQCRLGMKLGCVKVAGAGKRVPARYDPRVELVFTAWLPILVDRQAAISVAPTGRLAGVTRGDCFSVEPVAASLTSPVDPGVYCYDRDGTLTGVRAGFGTLVLSSTPVAPPPTIPLPGPVTASAGIPTTSPSPSPSPSVSGSASASPSAGG